MPLGTVIALDATDFVRVGGDVPRFERSDQATLHMEDTAPVKIVSGSDWHAGKSGEEHVADRQPAWALSIAVWQPLSGAV